MSVIWNKFGRNATEIRYYKTKKSYILKLNWIIKSLFL